MCDYSLMGVPNRQAKEGEELVLYKFPSNTKGFASPGDVARTQAIPQKLGLWEGLRSLLRGPNLDEVTAVCIMPGTRLLLQDIPLDFQRSLDVNSIEEVTFTQLTYVENVHRDAVRFGNGSEVSLQRLSEGQRIKILSFDLDMEPIPLRQDDMVLHFG